MLARFDHSSQVRWTEPRRRRQQHYIDVAVDQLLKRVQSEELLTRFDFHLFRRFVAGGLPKRIETRIYAPLVDIRYRREHRIVVRFQCLGGRSRATPAAAHQANTNRLPRCAPHHRRESAHQRSRFQQISS